MPRLPTEKDFAPYGDLDAQYAWKNFGGLTLDEAKKKFAEDPEYYGGDFLWMGSRAFAFYYPVIDAYLREMIARREPDIIPASWLGYVIKQQFTGTSLRDVIHLAPRIRELARFILDHIDLFDPDRDPDLDVAGKWQRLEEHLQKIA